MSTTPGRPSRGARAASLVSALLIIAGVSLLLAAGAMQVYTMYAQMRWERAQAALSVQFIPPPVKDTATPFSSATPPASATASAPSATPPASIAAPAATTATAALPTALPQGTRGAATATIQPATPTILPTATATVSTPPTRTPSPTPTRAAAPGHLLIPKLKLDARIVGVPLVNGQWDVDKIVYDVGLLGGTGWPGERGNAAISGHVTLLGRGSGPFRWLERLAPGDEIIVQQGDVRFIYLVQENKVVEPTDVSVLAPTDEATLTLITCTDWNFLRAEYSRRLIIGARLAGWRDGSVPAQ